MQFLKVVELYLGLARKVFKNKETRRARSKGGVGGIGSEFKKFPGYT